MRRYTARPEAEIAAWALRRKGVAAELRRIPSSVAQTQTINESSALLVPRDDVGNARDVLSSDRLRTSDDQGADAPPAAWFPASPREISAGLAEIQRRERLARFWSWSFLPVVALAGFTVSTSLSSGLAVFWFAGIAISRWRASSCDCPRCGLPFGRDASLMGSWRAAFSRRCLTCNLPR